MAARAMPAHPETLPASWYHDPAIFAREQDSVFAKHWTPVARLAQLKRPGDFVCNEIAGRPTFVIRGRDGEVMGFHNVCRHRAGPILTEAAGHCDVLRCRYHGWVYGHDGALIRASRFDESGDFDRTQFALYSIRVAVWNGIVFAVLDPASPDLETWLGDVAEVAETFPPIADMVFRRDVALEGDANWKAYGDNSVEGYHLPHVHRDLSKALHDERIDIRAYERGGFVGFKVRYGASSEGGKGRGFWIYKFPGVLLHFSERAFNLQRVVPLAPRRIRLQRWFWALEDGDHRRDDAAQIDASLAVMREDLDICAAVQRNLEAGVYDRGRLSPSAEPGTIFFQGLVRAALSAGPQC